MPDQKPTFELTYNHKTMQDCPLCPPGNTNMVRPFDGGMKGKPKWICRADSSHRIFSTADGPIDRR